MNIVTKSYESLLPFLVVEALSARGISYNSMSVKIIDKGWAWLVSGRNLLIWKFKDPEAQKGAKTRRMISPCYDLQLPQSDLVHKAELIQVFFMPANLNTSSSLKTIPAALVISPEGTVRFWSNITSERYAESSIVDMPGQEFCTLASLSNLEYLIGTTTGSVFLLSINTIGHDPKSALLCTPLNTPSSLLSGIGRRMTNLFFGQMATEAGTDSRRPLITVPKYSQSTIDKTGSTDRPFFVMSSSFKLRQWSRTNEGIHSCNQLVREWDLQKNVYTKLISGLNLSESDSLNFWPIDMITTKSKELLILIVTLDSARDNLINYATCVFDPYQAGDSISNLTVLRSHSWHYSNESEDQLLALRFLERRTTNSVCFLYDRKFLFLVKVDQDILDAVDYGNQADGVLGAGMIEGHPLLFTQRDGLTYVVPVASNRSMMNETSIQLDPPQVMNRSRAHNSQLSSSTRVDPMVIEIDIDEEPENETNNTNEKNQSTTFNSSKNETAETSRVLESWKNLPKEFEWVEQIDSKQYGLAGETLAKLAKESELLEDRKETLMALSKLAILAE